MADGLPDTLVLLHVAGEPPAAPGAASAALDPSAITLPAERFLAQPDAAFLRPASAQSLPPSDPGPPSFSVRLTLNGKPTTLTTDADSIADQLIALYLSGGWDWANALLEGVTRTAAPLPPVRTGILVDPGQMPIHHGELLRRAAEGVAILNSAIEDAVVELALEVLDRARRQAPRVRVALEQAEQRYGVRRKPREPAREGASPTGAEGGPGTSDTLGFEVRNPAEPAAATDLMDRLRGLVGPYLALQRVLDLAEAPPPEARPPGARPPPGAERSPYPGPPSDVELDAARRDYRMALEAVARDHPVGPGVFALCIPDLLKDPQLPLEEQRMLSAIFEFFRLAELRMMQLPEQYPESVLRYVVKEPLSKMAGKLGASIADTPEMRAMWWASRPEKHLLFEPLLATQMIDAIRSELVRSQPPDDEELVRTAFMLAVIHGLGLSKRDVGVLRLAQLDNAERPFKRFDKTAALLSLVGLVLPPVDAAAAAVGVYSLYGHCVNQFAALSALESDAETRAVDALLSDDAAGFALALGERPDVAEVLGEAAASMARDLVLAKVAPAVAIAMQIWEDGKTLVE